MRPELVAPGARLIDASTGRVVAGADLAREVDRVAEAIRALPDGTVFVRTSLNIESMLRYLGCWAAGRPVAILDPALDSATLTDMTERFAPAAILGVEEGGADAANPDCPAGYSRSGVDPLGVSFVRTDGLSTPPPPHPDLALLLATSGSTGSPRLVRLSWRAVHANAVAIAESLGLDGDEVAPTSLPIFYSYGMSVMNSHLVSGATVLVVDGGILSRMFWQIFARHRATSLAGVPYNYEMLHRIRWKPSKYASLRAMTQAGGRLRPELVKLFHEMMKEKGGTFRPMYGQTEATARIAVMPAHRLDDKVGSPGCALPGGVLSIQTDDGTETREASVEGEVVYRGPNVMMGYAESADDLSRGDDMNGVLHTGDVGYLDEEGFLFITGRLKRIGKIFGVRVNLDDIESIAVTALAGERLSVAAVAAGDRVAVWYEGSVDDTQRSEIARLLSTTLKLHRSGFEIHEIDRLPLLSNGKVDYRKLEAMP